MKAHAGGSDVARHPIAVVAERTGLSQDVLRVWERRYGAVQPERVGGGQRLYSDADVVRLGLLNAVTRAGRSIGQVARLATSELAVLVDEDVAAREALRAGRDRDGVPADAISESPALVATALTLARALEAAPLDESLRRAAARLGVSVFLEAVAAPLLRRVGDEWHAGRMTPAQEHLVSSVLHDIAAETLRSLTPPVGALRVVVATPAGDRHAIGAVLAAASAAMEGWNVLYLGADLPASEIVDAARAFEARAVALSVVYTEDPSRVVDELRWIRGRLPETVVLLAGGSGARALAPELMALGVVVETSLPGLVAELRVIH